MEPSLLPSSQFQPIRWSGGTTRELYLFPPEASYRERNFLFRLSTATVEAETSEFTALPGVSRKLMVLSGQITIHHDNQHSRQLGKFDTDSFEGDWKTTAVGTCTDFNLMTRGQTSGHLHGLAVEKGQSASHNLPNRCDWFFVYASAGSVGLNFEPNKITLQKGDLLVIPKPTEAIWEINGLENSELVFVEITVGP